MFTLTTQAQPQFYYYVLHLQILAHVQLAYEHIVDRPPTAEAMLLSVTVSRCINCVCPTGNPIHCKSEGIYQRVAGVEARMPLCVCACAPVETVASRDRQPVNRIQYAVP